MSKDEAISSLKNYCQELIEIIDNLEKQNEFLTETIEKNNLRKIVSERRSILKVADDADKKLIEAQKIRAEYDDKLSNINAKIDIESERKIENQKKLQEIECTNYKNDLKQQFMQYKKKNDESVKQVISKYKKNNHILIMITIISVIFGIGCSFIHYLFF